MKEREEDRRRVGVEMRVRVGQEGMEIRGVMGLGQRYGSLDGMVRFLFHRGKLDEN